MAERLAKDHHKRFKLTISGFSSSTSSHIAASNGARLAALIGAAGYIAPRHMRAFRTAVDRETSLLDAVIAPALRSRNPERRRAGVEDLQAMGEAAHELSQLLFWRNVRRLAGQ